jgi:hypothetical protein
VAGCVRSRRSGIGVRRIVVRERVRERERERESEERASEELLLGREGRERDG